MSLGVSGGNIHFTPLKRQERNVGVSLGPHPTPDALAVQTDSNACAAVEPSTIGVSSIPEYSLQFASYVFEHGIHVLKDLFRVFPGELLVWDDYVIPTDIDVL